MKSFNQFINENMSFDEATNIINIMKGGNIELGLILLKGLKAKPTDFIKVVFNTKTDDEFNKIIKLTGIPLTTVGIKRIANSNIEFLSNLNTLLKSDEVNSLMELGYTLDSGEIQLRNGTLVFVRPHSTRRLGIFPNGWMRRMQLRDEYGKDAKIKQVDGSGLELYKNAINWILENIDHDNNELLTKKATNSVVKSANELPIIVNKIYQEYEKLGFSPREYNILLDRKDMSQITATKDLLKFIKSFTSRGITPVFLYFSFEEIQSIVNILSKPGINWVKVNSNAHKLSIYNGIQSIWNNFNFKEQLSTVYRGGYGPRSLVLQFEDTSELDYYLQLFGIEINPKPQEVLDLDFLLSIGIISIDEYRSSVAKLEYRECKPIDGVKIFIRIYTRDARNTESLDSFMFS
jgi:hypothetical protein